jgi:hypothetical protein
METSDFLFTWKPEKWPYENLRALIDAFRAGQSVTERWRCSAHLQVGPGKRAYLFKQGAPPRGIFATAEIVGPAERNTDAEHGEARYVVPLHFEVLLDPTKRLLISEADLLRLPAPEHRWRTQASGVGLEPDVARAIDAVAARELRSLSLSSSARGSGTVATPEKVERLVEVYERDQVLVERLKRLYDGRCQICGSMPFNGLLGSITEAHHIQWLCRGGPDILGNMVLLCPNHHAAMHACDPKFDRGKLEFTFAAKVLPIRLDLHLAADEAHRAKP